jgi:hypothetical protein
VRSTHINSFIHTYIRTYIHTYIHTRTHKLLATRVVERECVCACECVFACSMSFVTLTINVVNEQPYVTEFLLCSVLHCAFHPRSCTQFILKCIRFKETLGLQWRLRGNFAKWCVLLKPHNESWLTQRSIAPSRIENSRSLLIWVFLFFFILLILYFFDSPCPASAWRLCRRVRIPAERSWISLFTSACTGLTVRELLMEYSWNLILRNFTLNCRTVSVLVKIRQK